MAGRRGPGEGSIFQRDDGRWVGRHTVNGKQKYIYAKTKREAQTALRKALADVGQGLVVVGTRQTVEEYLRYWLEACAKPSVRPRTLDCYKLSVKRVVAHVGTVRLIALTPVQVQACYAALLARGLSRRSVELDHSVLHCALKQAVKLCLLARNPTDAVTAPRPARKEMQTLTREQVRALFAETKGDRLHALWVLLVTTGLRFGEAAGLRWTDIHLASRTLQVQRALQSYLASGPAFDEPKTQRSRRQVVLASGAMVALRAHRALQNEERLAAGPEWQDLGLVFCKGDGAPLTHSPAVTRKSRRALARAGLPVIRIHDLRHTAATLLLQDGTHPKKVQEMLGHTSITMTLDLYSHVTPVMHAEIADRMQRLLEDDATEDWQDTQSR